MELTKVFLSSLNYAAPGAAGGLTLFLYSYKTGHYKNNQYIQKFSVEIIGGTIVAIFLSEAAFVVIKQTTATTLLVPFAIGLGWAKIIQHVRKWITKSVKNSLNK